MTKQDLFNKFGNILLDFSEYQNGTVTYMKSLLNGDILIKHIHYGNDILHISFSKDDTCLFSEPEPNLFDVIYLPKGEPQNNIEFLSL